MQRGNSAAALRRMRSLIERGRYQGRLPPERELAIELQIGRTTLRKALDVLEAEGQIWRHVGQGTFVGRRPPATGVEQMLKLGTVSPKELLDARLVLEPSIAACAATTARSSDIERIKMCARKRELAKEPDAYNLWDHQFHLAIAEATQNPILVGLLEQLNHLRRTPTWATYKKDRMKDPFYTISKREHRAIIAAIEEHNSGAAFQTMKAHIMGVQDGFYGWAGQSPAGTTGRHAADPDTAGSR